MVTEYLTAFLFIVVAEMGDKSQLLAMMFATKYKLRDVVIGLFLGITFNHVLAVIVGRGLSLAMDGMQISILAGTIFLVFAFFSLREPDEEVTSKVQKYGPILTVSFAFFVGELGDKTQFATVALSSESMFPLITLLGTVSAMMFTSMLGIVLGIRLGKKIPDFYIRLFSSVVFLGYGAIKIISINPNLFLTTWWIIIIEVVLFAIYTRILLGVFVKHRHMGISPFQRASAQLQQYYEMLSLSLDSICLGKDVCGTCLESKCLLGSIRSQIIKVIKGKPIKEINYKDVVIKEFNKENVMDALQLTLSIVRRHWKDPEYNDLHVIRRSLEMMLFDSIIESVSYKEYKTLLQQKQDLM